MLFVGLMFSFSVQARLLLVVSQDSSLYRSFETGFENALAERSSELVVKRADKLDGLAMGPFKVIVVAGVAAAKALAKHPLQDVEVLYTFMPRSSYNYLKNNEMLVGHFHALYIDQPPGRFVRFIKTALPDVSKLGYLSGNLSVEHTSSIQAEAAEFDMDVFSGKVDVDIKFNSVLKRAFSRSDALLVLPDPYLYNRRAIQSVLLASFRHQKPLFAYSESFVKAGALAALYSSPDEIGQFSAELAECLYANCELSDDETFYPKYFSVSINHVVARQLGLSVKDAGALEKALQVLEAKSSQ